ncbi:sulfotransferase family 2 domain-containing protein [Ruegeria sp. EL01]|jgi:hypothetical protein|uniref:sulfotransferase family 2 domain-containing protein n=1 Tax=Ruegeria sp. EL01 TaxID=2107578 RepID=UPI000EA82EC8|nr:sulfotransferase family 2 domain-containing protein [Ruegeria sp. EL01]
MHTLTRISTKIGWRMMPDRMIDQLQPKPDPHLEEVYLQRGLILIHIPKNAGTSVENALFGYRVRHRTWHEVKSECPRAWRQLPKIAILRDPVDRFLSAYDYLKSGGRNAQDRQFGSRMIGAKPVDDFLNRLWTQKAFRKTTMRFFHFRPQTDYVSDGETVMVDALVPFHKMAEGLTKLAGVPASLLSHANKTTGSRTQKSDLSQSSVDRIRHLYASDVELHADVCKTWDATSAIKPLVTQPADGADQR